MLDESLKITHETLALGQDMAAFIATMVSKDQMVLRVITEIAKHDRRILNFNGTFDDSDVIYGVTKEEIRKSIVTGYKIEKTGELKGKRVPTHPAIKIIDAAISFLMGATMVYYERNINREKRYLFTSRALEVIAELQKKGCISIVDIVADTQRGSNE